MQKVKSFLLLPLILITPTSLQQKEEYPSFMPSVSKRLKKEVASIKKYFKRGATSQEKKEGIKSLVRMGALIFVPLLSVSLVIYQISHKAPKKELTPLIGKSLLKKAGVRKEKKSVHFPEELIFFKSKEYRA